MGARIDVTEIVKGDGRYSKGVEKMEVILPDEIKMCCPACNESAFPEGQFHVRLTKQRIFQSGHNLPMFIGDCGKCEKTSLAAI